MGDRSAPLDSGPERGPILLELRDVRLYYRTEAGLVRAVDGVSLKIGRGETLALVGESGSGKSSTALAIMRLLPKNVAKFEGKILVNGEDVTSYSEEEYRTKVRWTTISMVFQGALNALNPVLRIGHQVAEPLIHHFGMRKEEALKRARRLLAQLGIPEAFAERYPHELSGGMRQRAVIGMALITDPQLVILDEPTSALDIITQANIINLLKRLKWERGLSYLFITHDLALASELADRLAVMYAGKVVEAGPAEEMYARPRHPYTHLLMRSVPLLRYDRAPLFIRGAPPDLTLPPTGCRFHPRCPYAVKGRCEVEEPPLAGQDDAHKAACWYPLFDSA